MLGETQRSVDQELNIPKGIQKMAEKFFGTNNVLEAVRILKLSKTSISFSRGDPNRYFIVSGIVKSGRTYECKVVYKKASKKKGNTVKSQCDCPIWSDQGRCPHTAGLYLGFLLRTRFSKKRPPHGPRSRQEGTSSKVDVKKYGTIISRPKEFQNDPSIDPHTTLCYLIKGDKSANFPIPEQFSGAVLLCLNGRPKKDPGPSVNVRFEYRDRRGKIHKKISLFENLYLVDWETGHSYHLPSGVRDFIQKIRGREQDICTNEFIRFYQKLRPIPSLELLIDGRPFEDIEEETLLFKAVLEPHKKSNLINMSFSFFDSMNYAILPPPLLSSLTFSGGLLHTFKRKKDAYSFVSSLFQSFVGKNESYKKSVYLGQAKDGWIDIIRFMKENEDFICYAHETKKRYSLKNKTIQTIFTSLYECFGESLFRYSTYRKEEHILCYKMSSSILFGGLSKFYNTLLPFKFSIFYNKNVVSFWNSKMYFKRRLKETKWFDLELNIGEEDLEVLKNADVENGVVLTKNGLTLLDKNQKELLKLMEKYIKYDGKEKEDEDEEEDSKNSKKFNIPFNRNRIFELFEMKRLGVSGSLTQEEEELCSRLIDLKEIPSYPLSNRMDDILRPYQKTGHDWLRFLYENHLGACLADDMGLGKTIQTISFICGVIDHIDRVLIICPISILLNWEREFKKVSDLNLYIYHGGERRFPENVKIILTSYGIMKKEIEHTFSDKNFDIVVLDEVQHLKNIRSLGAFAARKLNAGFRVCLTGTPIENDLTEFYNILDLSMPGVWGEIPLTKNISTHKSHAYAKKTAGPFVLRRTKGEVLKELPPKQEENVFLNFTDDEKRYYRSVLLDIKNKISLSPKRKKYGEILKGLLRLRQRCLWQGNEKEAHLNTEKINSTKIDFLIVQLEQILKENHQAIVFSQFTTYLDLIERFVVQRGWNFAKIDGTQSIKKRQNEVESFQNGEKNIFLISLKAGGVGLNLTAASYVFLMDPWWNPAVEQQAIDRAHRIGQKNTLIVYKPIIKDSIEEKVLELKEAKRELFNELLNKDDETLFKGNLSMKDFEHFFDSSAEEMGIL